MSWRSVLGGSIPFLKRFFYDRRYPGNAASRLKWRHFYIPASTPWSARRMGHGPDFWDGQRIPAAGGNGSGNGSGIWCLLLAVWCPVLLSIIFLRKTTDNLHALLTCTFFNGREISVKLGRLSNTAGRMLANMRRLVNKKNVMGDMPMMKKLLILDVNGLLVDTCFNGDSPKTTRTPDGISGRFRGMSEFVQS